VTATAADRSRTRLRIVRDDRAPAAWDDFLTGVPAADVFCTTRWHEALLRHYHGSQALWLAAYQDDRLVGGLVATGRLRYGLRRCFSGIEGTSGGPLVAAELSSAERQGVFAELAAAYRVLLGGRTVTVTMSLPRDQEEEFGASLAAGEHWRCRQIIGAVIPVDGGVDHVDKYVLSNNRRNERNRALKRGCTAAASNDPDLLAEFYPIYQAATLGWGVEAVPLAFLHDLLTAPGSPALLISIHHEGAVIGGHFCLVSGDRLVAWVGATLPRHNKQLFPATLIVWQEIVEACARGLQWVDLGGSGDITTLDRFKQLLGAQPEKRGHYTASVPWLSLARNLRSVVARRRAQP
jgi:hypothetical protein